MPVQAIVDACRDSRERPIARRTVSACLTTVRRHLRRAIRRLWVMCRLLSPHPLENGKQKRHYDHDQRAQQHHQDCHWQREREENDGHDSTEEESPEQSQLGGLCIESGFYRLDLLSEVLELVVRGACSHTDDICNHVMRCWVSRRTLTVTPLTLPATTTIRSRFGRSPRRTVPAAAPQRASRPVPSRGRKRRTSASP